MPFRAALFLVSAAPTAIDGHGEGGMRYVSSHC